VVGLPLVELAVSVGVFFRAGEPAAVVVLDARHRAVAPGRDLDARRRAVGVAVLPRIFLPVVLAREADLLDLLVGVVVLPAIDLSVLVFVNFDTDDARAVHVAPGVDDAVAVGVVLQELQATGRFVVFGRDSLLGVGLFAALTRHRE